MPVYVIQAGDGGPVKIGFAENVSNRLVKMQVDNHVRLSVIAVFVGDRAHERELHKRFAAHAIHGEWFAALIVAKLASVEWERCSPPPAPGPRPFGVARSDETRAKISAARRAYWADPERVAKRKPGVRRPVIRLRDAEQTLAKVRWMIRNDAARGQQITEAMQRRLQAAQDNRDRWAALAAA